MVIAFRSATDAKSRFVTLPATARAGLAVAMLADTVAAARGAAEQIVIVTKDDRLHDIAGDRLPTDVVIMAERPEPPGLNGALTQGLEAIGSDVATVVTMLADLPALTTASLSRFLTAAAASQRPVLLTDADGLGTTMLAAGPAARAAERLAPRFGGASAQRHRRHGAYDPFPADELIDARTDVDRAEDLVAARRIGVGRHTAAWLNGSLASR